MNKEKTLEHYQDMADKARNYMKTASVDSVHGDEDIIDIPPEVREAKIAEIVESLKSDSINVVLAVRHARNNEDDGHLDILVSMLYDKSPATDAERRNFSLSQSENVLYTLQSLHETIDEHILGYAEHLYDEGNY